MDIQFKLPKWGKYVVLDKDGTIWVFEAKPKISYNEIEWVEPTQKRAEILGELEMQFVEEDYWRESLVEVK